MTGAGKRTRAEEAVLELGARIEPPDAATAAAARARHDRLTKPPGSLGVLEDLGVRLAAMSRRCPPPVPARPVLIVAAGDHGVLARGVSPWPAEVTAAMVAVLCRGRAGANALARVVGAGVTVLDAGVATPLTPHPRLRRAGVRRGTADLSEGPAMTRDEASRAILAGAHLVEELAGRSDQASDELPDQARDRPSQQRPDQPPDQFPDQARDRPWQQRLDRPPNQIPDQFPNESAQPPGHPADLLVTGDMGIGNTTPAACLIAAFTGRPAVDVTGRGTGIDDETLDRKRRVVDEALCLHRPSPSDPVGVLACVGGLEHAALAGVILGAAGMRLPVVLDGVSAGAAALVAAGLCQHARGYMIAGHRSVEPGATAALEHLGLPPLLDLRMRLGEGTGALLAVPLVQSAAAALAEMPTFEEAGLAEAARDAEGSRAGTPASSR